MQFCAIHCAHFLGQTMRNPKILSLPELATLAMHWPAPGFRKVEHAINPLLLIPNVNLENGHRKSETEHFQKM